MAMSAPLVLAGDIIAMPTGNLVPPQTAELHYIYWNREPISTPGGPVRDYLNIGEVHAGIVDRLELDALFVNTQGLDDVWELNAYYALVPESREHPSLIVGATNLTENDWLPSSMKTGPQGDNRVSAFVVSAYNFLPAAGPPSLNDPLLRLHAGWGENWHENRFFGAAQILVHPQVGFGIFTYQGKPAYLASYKPVPWLELNAGWDQGDPVYHIGYTKTW